MLLLKIDHRSAEPIYRQIIQEVVRLVDRGTLEADAVMPPTRKLAATLGVDRSTVCRAYEELWALGYVEARPGSYTRVRRRPGAHGAADAPVEGRISWESASTAAARTVYRRFTTYRAEPSPRAAAGLVNLSRLDMDARLLPVDELRRAMHQVLLRDGEAVMGYCDRQGDPRLRDEISRRLGVHGISASRDDLLVTNGSQNAIDLVLRLLVSPGRRVVVESPTYGLILPLLELHGAELVPVPMGDAGMDLDALEKALSSSPALVYTIPNFHNPTGVTTTQEHRERLLALCERHGVPLVEDGFEEEMKYFGKVPLPIKAMDATGSVIYLGTFSKVLMPGARIGWIAADRDCILRLLAVKRFADLSSSGIMQAAVAELAARGDLHRHIRRMHRVFRKRMSAALDGLRRHLPRDRATWTEPAGGYLIWVRLHDLPDGGDDLNRMLEPHGVLVSPGEFYSPDGDGSGCFRISISALDEEEIAEGMRRLGRALRELPS